MGHHLTSPGSHGELRWGSRGWCPPGEQREKGPLLPHVCSPTCSAGAGALSTASKPAGPSKGKVWVEGRRSGCPAQCVGKAACPRASMERQPKGGHPGQCAQEASRTQDTVHSPACPLAVSPPCPTSPPTPPRPTSRQDVNTHKLLPLKQQVGGFGAGAAAVWRCSAYLAGRRCGKGSLS